MLSVWPWFWLSLASMRPGDRGRDRVRARVRSRVRVLACIRFNARG